MRTLPAILMMTISLSACEDTMKQYKKENLNIVSVEQHSTGDTEILYQVILDSMYYCPGVTLRSHSDRQEISFVRCGIDKKCHVDVRAEQAGPGQWKIRIPAPAANISLIFSDGEMRLKK